MLKTILTPDKAERTEDIVTGDAWKELVNRQKEENAERALRERRDSKLREESSSPA